VFGPPARAFDVENDMADAARAASSGTAASSTDGEARDGGWPTDAVRFPAPARKPHWQTARSGWSIGTWSRTRTSPARIFGCTC